MKDRWKAAGVTQETQLPHRLLQGEEKEEESRGDVMVKGEQRESGRLEEAHCWNFFFLIMRVELGAS